MKEAAKVLTEGELEIMQVVWDLQSCTVRQVYEKLRSERSIAYTTVMTMMNILEDKGHLKRERAARAYVYLPTQPKSKVISSLVNNFLTKVFDGSAKPLVMNLLKERKLSETDLEEISAMIEEQR